MGFVSCIVDTEGRRQIKRWLQGQPSVPPGGQGWLRGRLTGQTVPGKKGQRNAGTAQERSPGRRQLGGKGGT